MIDLSPARFVKHFNIKVPGDPGYDGPSYSNGGVSRDYAIGSFPCEVHCCPCNKRGKCEMPSNVKIGPVRFRGRYCVIGVANTRKHRLRGAATRANRKTRLPDLIIVGKHLPANGPMVTETLIHEALHIAFPRKKEREIREAASLVIKVLRRAEKAKVPSRK